MTLHFFNESIFEITNTCIDWCREAQLVHQNNLRIEELGIIGVALISLLANHLIETYWDFILEKSEVTERNLQILQQSTSYFTFVLLVLFLGYNVFFK